LADTLTHSSIAITADIYGHTGDDTVRASVEGQHCPIYPRRYGYAAFWVGGLLMAGLTVPFFFNGPLSWSDRLLDASSRSRNLPAGDGNRLT
jgi:hypothetical protein